MIKSAACAASPMTKMQGGPRLGPSPFVSMPLSTRIKDAGIAIRHSRGRILFYTAGSGNGLEGRGGVCGRILNLEL